MKNLILVLTVLLVIGLCGSGIPAGAAVNLSVNPLNSGDSIRLGHVDAAEEVSSEVKIRITASDGKPYQVFQRLIDPLVSEQGQPLNRDAVESYTLSHSNAYGTLYGDYPEGLSSGEQLLYSSGGTGESDVFTVVYKVRGDRLGASGNFLGRVMYTVRSAGGSDQDTAYLNVTLTGGGRFQTDVKGSLSRDEARIVYDDGKIEDGYVRISFTDNPGTRIRVFQQQVSVPQNDLFEEIGRDVIVMKTEGAAGGIQDPSWTPLKTGKTLLFESESPSGEWDVIYSLNKEAVKNQKAGVYRGQIKLFVETAEKSEEFSLNLEADVRPLFRLEVELPPGGIRFAKVLPEMPPQEQEIAVAVKTNLGKPYVVIQSLGSLLTNAGGDVIPEKYFTMKGALVEAAGGTLAQSEDTPVTRKEQPVFFSDGRGSPASFKVLYRLRSFSEMKPGDYSTAITYSLGEK